jgi:penicillin-binding protein 1A
MQDAKQNWQVVQLPQVEAALVSVVPQDGAIRALVGGFDFTQNNFNHVTQAWRQPGSTFKPFIYSAALEKGFAPGLHRQRCPVSYPAGPGQPNWEPKDDETPAGPITVRTALQKSVNLVAIRTLDYIGVPTPRTSSPAPMASMPTRSRPTCPWHWVRARPIRCSCRRPIRCLPTAATRSSPT